MSLFPPLKSFFPTLNLRQGNRAGRVRELDSTRANTGEPQPTTTTRPTAFSILKLYPNFRLLLVGNFLAVGAQWVQILTIAWLVLKLTDGNAFLTGAVVGIRTFPVLIIGPWAGVLADRMDRRKLVMATQLVMTVAAIVFAFLVVASDLDSDPVSGPLRWWHPFVYMILAGTAHSIIQPVRQAMVANTVPRHDLASALALNGIAYPSTRIGGPALGGLLIATLGFDWNFILEAIAYLSIVLLLMKVSLPYKEESTRPRLSVLASMAEGLRYVRGQKSILQLIIVSIIPNMVNQPLILILPIFTVEVLDRGAGSGGILTAAVGAGGVVAAISIATIGFVFKKGVGMFAGLLLSCILVLLFAQSTWYLVSIGLLVGVGFGQYVFRVANSVLVQTIVPDAVRGRVMSIYMLDHAFVGVSTLLISLAVHVWNPSDTFTVVAIVGLGLSIMCGLAFREARQLE